MTEEDWYYTESFPNVQERKLNDMDILLRSKEDTIDNLRIYVVTTIDVKTFTLIKRT